MPTRLWVYDLARFTNVVRRPLSKPFHQHQTVFQSTVATTVSAFSAMMAPSTITPSSLDRGAVSTQILPVDASRIGTLLATKSSASFLDEWDVQFSENEEGVRNLKLAAEQLRTSNIPVAFPTETVYGLGADATRSDAVKGIYAAKQRPLDNPLIVHFSSLHQLRSLLSSGCNSNADSPSPAIPSIYEPLISRFWPGPLTIILPNPSHSPLAPEVTAGLPTFGARIPRNLLALLLIKLSNKPIAAPSANASTKPSPTAAEHVKEDLDGRIQYIIDGGPCDVGVESTVVDGLSDPPAILRPGGISIEDLRACPGWENVVVGYEDVSMKNGAPRAPGMKYRHYSPKARVVLYDPGAAPPTPQQMSDDAHSLGGAIGIVSARKWKAQPESERSNGTVTQHAAPTGATTSPSKEEAFSLFDAVVPVTRPHLTQTSISTPSATWTSWQIELGDTAADVARDLFWALRELDRKQCSVIHVEGISDEEGNVAAAVMNRLRKAAEVHVSK